MINLWQYFRVQCEWNGSLPVILGSGHFGQVYRANLQIDGDLSITVAAKSLKCWSILFMETIYTQTLCLAQYGAYQMAYFLEECLTLAKAGQHENIVTLSGTTILNSLKSFVSFPNQTKIKDKQYFS